MLSRETKPRETLLLEKSIADEFANFRSRKKFLKAQLRLWVPDAGSAAFAWAGKMHNLVLGRVTISLRIGILPGIWRGRVAHGALGCVWHARDWIKKLPSLGSPRSLFELASYAFINSSVALRTAFRRDRFDLIMAISENNTGLALALAERRFYLSESTVEHYWLQVVKTAQSQGIATRVFAALLPLYEQLKCFRVRLTAGLSAGGAVWAKFGFVPDPLDWSELRERVLLNISDVRQFTLSNEVERALNAATILLNIPDPKGVWAISDIAVQHPAKPKRLGPCLLQGTRWRGTLDFKDREAVKRLQDCFIRNGIGCGALFSLAAAANADR